MNLSKLAIEKRAVTLAFVLILLLWGISVFFNISRREDPEITIRASLLMTLWPGAEVEKIEQLVTRPLEIAIKEITEVKTITSDSRVGISSIIIKLMDSVKNPDEIWNKVRAKIQRVEPYLPEGCQTPDLNTDFGEVAVMVLAMYQVPAPGQDKIHKKYTMREMDDMLKELEDVIQEIPMVGKISKHGIQKEVIYVEADAQDWGQLAISAKNLIALIQKHNSIAPGGNISSSDLNYTIKPSGEFLHHEHIKSVVIGSKDGAPIHLGDLNLHVDRRYAEPKDQYCRFVSPGLTLESKKCDCLILSFAMRSGYNVVELGKVVRSRLQEISHTLFPPDIRIEVVNDIPSQVSSSIYNFLNNLWQAIVLVIGVALVIIGVRVSIIMATAIPLSIITAIACMSLFDVVLEQCSIASLIIALGMLVDNAVIVSDNVLRLMEKGIPKKEACWRGAQELFVPVLTSTLTTVAAFLPMLLIPDDTGEYIRSLPIMVTCTLMISLLVAMTVTPVMCFLLLKEKKGEPDSDRKQTKIITTGVLGKYATILQWSLSHKSYVFCISGILLIASLCLIPLIGTAFFPKDLRNQFWIEIELPSGSSIAHTGRIVDQVEDILLQKGMGLFHGKKVQRFQNAVCYLGQSGPRFFLSIDEEPPRPHYAQIMVNTTSKKYTDSFIQEVQLAVKEIAGARVVVRPLNMGPPVRTPICFRVRGYDPDILLSLAQEIQKHLEKIEGTYLAHNSWGNHSYQIAIDIDQDAANLAGISNMDVAHALYGYFSGITMTIYREDRHQIPVVLRVRPDQRKNLDYLDYLYLEGEYGKVPLNAVAKVDLKLRPALIQRRNLLRTIEVKSFLEEGYLASKVVREMIPVLKEKISFPPGYIWDIGGEYEETSISQKNVAKALEISLFLILLTLVVQFNSFAKPLIILSTLPMSLIGALFGVWISGWPLAFMPVLGIVSLGGVVVNNAIILIDFIQVSVANGNPLYESIICAGQQRMRAIMITTFTTVGGFIPLAVSGGPLWEGMAYVMIFGLLSSTLLTLILIPLVFMLFVEKFKMKVLD